MSEQSEKKKKTVRKPKTSKEDKGDQTTTQKKTTKPKTKESSTKKKAPAKTTKPKKRGRKKGDRKDYELMHEKYCSMIRHIYRITYRLLKPDIHPEYVEKIENIQDKLNKYKDYIAAEYTKLYPSHKNRYIRPFSVMKEDREYVCTRDHEWVFLAEKLQGRITSLFFMYARSKRKYFDWSDSVKRKIVDGAIELNNLAAELTDRCDEGLMPLLPVEEEEELIYGIGDDDDLDDDLDHLIESEGV